MESENTAFGDVRLMNTITGNSSIGFGNNYAYNICIGKNAGLNLTTGHHNILIGENAGCDLTIESYMFVSNTTKKIMTEEEYEEISKGIISSLITVTGDDSVRIGEQC